MAQSPATPAVTLRDLNGAWWFVDASGHPFVSLGMDHVEPALLLGPNNRRRTLKRYGSDFAHLDGRPDPGSDGVRRWLKRVRVDLETWGFNTFGYHTGVPRHLLGQQFHYVGRACACPMAFPDVFSDAFAREVAEHAARACRETRGDPLCLGHAFADRPPWRLPDEGMHPWVARLAALPPSAPGKQAWMRVLLERHEHAATVASAYGLDAGDWDDLAAATEWASPHSTAVARADSEAMLSRVAERWYQLHAGAVRREDPGRLVLGDALSCDPAGLPAYLPPILARHADLLCIQWEAPFSRQEAVLRSLHEATGLPILLGDLAFSVHLDGHRPCSKGIPVADHLEVGRRYAECLRGAMEAGFVVGWHYGGYIEGGEGVAAEHDPDLHRQCGLLDPDENEHAAAVAWIRAANVHASVWHARSPW